METLGTIGFLLLIVILILLVWNIYEFIKHKKGVHSSKEKYFELKAKLNFIIAVGSLFLLLLT
ncbi:MAG: hypothetical protein RAP70_05670 [Candidatus Celaenobacter antarcticus]|nr:hypothetical protein [Candidatus Celaenobacter antarcticus]